MRILFANIALSQLATVVIVEAGDKNENEDKLA
jgi:hypothetical protein